MGCTGSKPHLLLSSSLSHHHHHHHHTNSPQKGFILFNANTIEYLKANESDIKSKLMQRSRQKLVKASGYATTKSLFGTTRKNLLATTTTTSSLPVSNQANGSAGTGADNVESETNGVASVSTLQPASTVDHSLDKSSFKETAIESAVDYVLKYAINDFDIDDFKSSNHLSMKQIRKDIMKKNQSDQRHQQQQQQQHQHQNGNAGGAVVSKDLDTTTNSSSHTAATTSTSGNTGANMTTMTMNYSTLKHNESTFYKQALYTAIDEFGLFIQENFIVINEFKTNGVKCDDEETVDDALNTKEEADKMPAIKEAASTAKDTEATLKLKEALELARQNFYKGKLSMVCLNSKTGGYVVKEVKESGDTPRATDTDQAGDNVETTTPKPQETCENEITNDTRGEKETHDNLNVEEKGKSLSASSSIQSSPITPENLTSAKTVTILDPQTNQKSKVAISSKINIEDVDISATFKIIETKQGESASNASLLNASLLNASDLSDTTKQLAENAQHAVKERVAELKRAELLQLYADVSEQLDKLIREKPAEADDKEFYQTLDTLLTKLRGDNISQDEEVSKARDSLGRHIQSAKEAGQNDLGAHVWAALERIEQAHLIKSLSNSNLNHDIEKPNNFSPTKASESPNPNGVVKQEQEKEKEVEEKLATTTPQVETPNKKSKKTNKNKTTTPSSTPKTKSSETPSTPKQNGSAKKKSKQLQDSKESGSSKKTSSPFKKIIDIKKEIAISILNVGEVLAKTIDYYSLSNSSNKEEDLKELIKISEQQAAAVGGGQKSSGKNKKHENEASMKNGATTTIKITPPDVETNGHDSEHATNGHCMNGHDDKESVHVNGESTTKPVEATNGHGHENGDDMIVPNEDVDNNQMNENETVMKKTDKNKSNGHDREKEEEQDEKQPIEDEEKEKAIGQESVTNGTSNGLHIDTSESMSNKEQHDQQEQQQHQQQVSSSTSSLSSPSLSTTSSLSTAACTTATCEPNMAVVADKLDRVVIDDTTLTSDKHEICITTTTTTMTTTIADEEKTTCVTSEKNIEQEPIEQAKRVDEDHIGYNNEASLFHNEISFLAKEMLNESQPDLRGDEHQHLTSESSSSDCIASNGTNTHDNLVMMPKEDEAEQHLVANRFVSDVIDNAASRFSDKCNELGEQKTQNQNLEAESNGPVVYRQQNETRDSTKTDRNSKRMSLDEELIYQLEQVDKKVKYMNETCSENEDDDDDDDNDDEYDYDYDNNERDNDERLFHPARTPAKIKSEVRQQRSNELQEEIKQISNVIQDLVQTINVKNSRSSLLVQTSPSVIQTKRGSMSSTHSYSNIPVRQTSKVQLKQKPSFVEYTNDANESNENDENNTSSLSFKSIINTSEFNSKFNESDCSSRSTSSSSSASVITQSTLVTKKQQQQQQQQQQSSTKKFRSKLPVSKK